MKIALNILLLFIFSLSFSQTKVDSLFQEISTIKNDSLKIELYIDLYLEHHRSDQQKALDYTILAEELAKKSGLKNSLARSKFRKGDALANMNLYDQAYKEYREALSYFETIADRKKIATVKIEIARLYTSQSKYEEAITLYVETLQLVKDIRDKNAEARIYNSLGTLNNILNQQEKAIENYKNALRLVEELNFKPGISACLTNLGMIYLEIKQYKEALPYLEKALILKKESNDKLGASRVLLNLSNLFLNKKEYTKARDYCIQSYEYAKQVNNPNHLKTVEYSLAEIEFNQGNYEQCITLLDKLITNSDLNLASKAHKLLANVYEKKKDYLNAYKNEQMHTVLADSLFAKKILLATNDLESKYQNKQKAEEIALLKTKNELTQQQKENQQNLYLAGLVITSIAGLFFYFQYRNRKRLNKKLKELNQARSDFFANISHEFRTPLTLISGPIQKKLSSKKIKKSERKRFEMANRNVKRLTHLVNQLLDISKIETGHLKLKVDKQEIFPVFKALTDNFKFAIGEKQIAYIVNLDTLVNAKNTFFDKDFLEKILVNLLSNATKYTPKKGIIKCNALIIDGVLHLEVKNSGKGIPDDVKLKIFNRFYQVDDFNQGVGIGLALVKDLVELHYGTITVDSKPNHWTTFKVEIPIEKKVFSEAELVKVAPDTFLKNHKSSFSIEETQDLELDDLHEESQKPVMLIVDDNLDIRLFLKDFFQKKYAVICGENGEEGIEFALQNIPDVIISDVMMPIKNGIQLCDVLKNDQRTSHIPIILLTAKVGEINEIKGIKTGADDYITKPFNNDLLKLKVKQLIENRNKLRERYSHEFTLKPNTIAINSTDELFLERVISLFNIKIVDPSFSIEEFSTKMGMSRMQLHRKLKALTGHSTSEFIRSQRLKLATRLLKKEDTKVSDIGYSVGFSDHAYFSKCFKEVYKCTPSEYGKKKTT